MPFIKAEIEHITFIRADDGTLCFECHVSHPDYEKIEPVILPLEFFQSYFPDHEFNDDEDSFFLLYGNVLEMDVENSIVKAFISVKDISISDSPIH